MGKAEKFSRGGVFRNAKFFKGLICQYFSGRFTDAD
jgi:hypothetical protein